MAEPQSSAQVKWGPLRNFLWPVHREELKKLLPMLLIFFLISFNYNILRTMKDTLVVTARSSGAEVIPYIKVWMMFPSAVLMTFLYTRLSNRFSREKVFYYIISIFLVYFFFFTFYFFPNQDTLHPHALADRLQTYLPQGLSGFVAMYRNWTFTIFYVMCELWGNIVLFVLCWGFANQVTRLSEAKRFYGLFGFGANLSGIFAGLLSVHVWQMHYNPALPFGNEAWEQGMVILMTLVLISGVAVLISFRWLNQVVLKDPRFFDPNDIKGTEKKKRLSLRENFSLLKNSNYLLSVTGVVLSYNIAINLIEVVWKDQIKQLYPNQADYSIFINQVSTIIGVIATLASILVSGNSLRRYGWTTTAMITPIIIGGTSIAFFSLYFMRDSLEASGFTLLGLSPLALIVFLGALQNILCRGAKYTVFDTTKEMAFVPLPEDEKIKSQAAIDGVCNRLGKSAGSLIQQTLLIFCSTLSASAPFIASILLGIVGLWAMAVKSLGIHFNALSGDATTHLTTKKNEEVIA